MLQLNRFNDEQENIKEIKCPRCKSFNFIKSGKDSAGKGKQKYRCKDCKKIFLENPDYQHSGNTLLPDITPEEMLKLDLWDLRILGLKPSISSGQYTLNFSKIQQQWLKIAAKHWLKYRTAIDETTTIVNKVKSITKFSKLIQFHYPNLMAEELNRDVIVDYLVYLKEKQNSTGTRIQDISCLSQFLENCARFNWASLPQGQMIFAEDYPKKETSLPRFIPNNVLKQIEDNLDALPQPVVCIVKVLRETGIRISELCSLKLYCIRQDKTGTWWIDIYQNKMKKEIPPLTITKELATAIQEQQQYIKDNLGTDFSHLFSETKYRSSFSLAKYKSKSKYIRNQQLTYFEPIPQKLHPETVRGYLYKFATERNIRDTSGEIFPLGKCHRFRHTHGTELINAGVPQHIVQKRLGHKYPEMTSTYTHIHDETMKLEMEKFWDGKLVNIKGEEIESLNPDLDTSEMQWFKKNMKAQALATGWCRLPVTQTCDIQGDPCHKCEFFATEKQFLPVLKQELENTEKVIKKAKDNGWQRQLENNEPKAKNLQEMIHSLEGDEKNA